MGELFTDSLPVTTDAPTGAEGVLFEDPLPVTLAGIVQADTVADLPTGAGYAGSLGFTTDGNIAYTADGLTWNPYGVGATGPQGATGAAG
jgi:hypothetical protein